MDTNNLKLGKRDVNFIENKFICQQKILKRCCGEGYQLFPCHERLCDLQVKRNSICSNIFRIQYVKNNNFVILILEKKNRKLRYT